MLSPAPSFSSPPLHGPSPSSSSSPTKPSTTTISLMLRAASLALLIDLCSGLRCYTDVSATKSMSTECGLNTGCVKIYIDSEEMLLRQQRENPNPTAFGEMPKLPERYENDPVLMRGCFVLAVPDRCYNAKSGLSYCWCSTKDLCNGGDGRHGRTDSKVTMALAALAVAVSWWRTMRMWDR